MAKFQIINADVRQALKELPAASAHMVCTSPPYWGLRAYQTEPQVWGGETDCEHVWGAEMPRAGSEYREGLSTSVFAGREDKAEIREAFAKPRRTRKTTDVKNPDSKQATNKGAQYGANGGQFCQLCGAWRGELGSEPTLELFIAHLVEVFREVKRVLRDDGTCWVNLGDSYASSTKGDGGASDKQDNNRGSRFGKRRMDIAGLKPKDLCGVPWKWVFAMQADGWWLRSDIIWHKPNPMPESVTDRPTKSHEYVFLLTKSAKYFYDAEAVREENAQGAVERFGKNPTISRDGRKYEGMDGISLAAAASKMSVWSNNGRNLRSVWTIPTEANSFAHFATFPRKLVEPCIRAGTSERGCCKKCGAPYERVVEKGSGGTTGRSWHDHSADGYKGNAKTGSSKGYEKGATTGFRPTCSCDAGEPVPAVVLDPFSGTGTSGVVALGLGRDYIGLELQAEYAEHSKKRLAATMPLFPGKEKV